MPIPNPGGGILPVNNAGTPYIPVGQAPGTSPGILGPAPNGGGEVASSWTVTGVRQSTMTNGQTYVPSVIVSFVTGLGNYGNTELAASVATQAAINAAVQQAADFLDGIAGLSSGNGASPSPLG